MKNTETWTTINYKGIQIKNTMEEGSKRYLENTETWNIIIMYKNIGKHKMYNRKRHGSGYVENARTWTTINHKGIKKKKSAMEEGGNRYRCLENWKTWNIISYRKI